MANSFSRLLHPLRQPTFSTVSLAIHPRLLGIGVGLLLACALNAFGAPDSDLARAAQLRSEALSYEHGEGVPRDGVRAASLYCEAVRLGDPDAPYDLGWLYANGRGVTRDSAQAAYFFKLAADAGYPRAADMLARMGEVASEMPDCLKTAPTGKDDLSDFTDVDQRVLAIVLRLAPQYGVSPRLVAAVIRTESNFNGAAVSPKNAQGLMQLIPETSLRFNVRKPFDPEQNIRGGMSYLRWLLAYFQGNVPLVAAAYNAGEGAVNRYRGIPPYEETQNYVKRIMVLFGDESHPYDPAVTEPSPELPRFRAKKRST